MPKGKVRFYDADKGFGFITAEDGTEVFLHSSVLPQGVSVRPGLKVSFSMADGRKGPQALQVEIIEEPVSPLRRTRKNAEELVPIIEDLIRLLDGASTSLRRGKYPENSEQIARVLRGTADRFGA